MFFTVYSLRLEFYLLGSDATILGICNKTLGITQPNNRSNVNPNSILHAAAYVQCSCGEIRCEVSDWPIRLAFQPDDLAEVRPS